MAEPFLAEIRIMSFNFPPKGWALCNGQFLPINQNQALFSLLGTSYGGNGQTTFSLPDIRGRVPIHVGSGFTQGQAGGQEFHTVTTTEMPQHFHTFTGTSADSDSPAPASDLPATASNLYTGPANLTSLNPATIGNIGGSQPHENRQPYSVLSMCIALQGIFPSQN
jgi:microcystin-dependent protein